MYARYTPGVYDVYADLCDDLGGWQLGAARDRPGRWLHPRLMIALAGASVSEPQYPGTMASPLNIRPRRSALWGASVLPPGQRGLGGRQ